MNVVVTGPSGHVGTNLVHELVARGHRVRAVCYDEAPSLHGLDVERVRGDVTRPETLRRAFDGQQWLFHLAGVISIDNRHRELMQAVNVRGTRNAAEIALECGVERMVHFSSIHALEVYGPPGPVDETVGPCTSAHSSAYDLSKAAGEAAVREVVARGLDAVIVHPTGVIGPHDLVPSHFGGFLLRVGRGVYPALVDGGFDWVDARDVATTAIAAAERGRTGHSYILGGGYASIADLARLTEPVTGVAVPSVVLPMGVARIGVPFSWLFSRLTGGPRTITGYTLDTLAAGLRVDSGKAVEELGHAPRALEQTVADTLRWFQAAGMLPTPEALATT